MKLKTIEVEIDGKKVTVAVVQDGKPVFVADDGGEVAYDVPAATTKITQLNGEARSHRERAEAAEKLAKAFEGVDPDAAKKALETVSNIDAGQLVAAGKVEEIKAAARQAAEEQVAAVVKAAKEEAATLTSERDTLKTQLDGALIGGSFGTSKFVAEKVAVPLPMLQKTYGDRFKVEDGKLVPYDATGNKIFSRANPGEVANFDEAIELMISADPFKEHILKGEQRAGGGAGQPGAGTGGDKTMLRSEFAKLPPADQLKAVGEYKIVDAT